MDEKGSDIRYLDIPELINGIAEGHNTITRNGTDFASLAIALQKLPKLSAVDLNYDWNPLSVLPGKFTIPAPTSISTMATKLSRHDDSLQRHLSVCLQAIHLSSNLSLVTTFEISCPSTSPTALKLDHGQIDLLKKVFAKIETLSITLEPLLKYLVQGNISMPVLKSLNLFPLPHNPSIKFKDLEQFFQRNGQHLRSLVISWKLLHDIMVDDKQRMNLQMLQGLHRIGQYCVLQHTALIPPPVSNDLKGLYDKVSDLLLRKIPYDDILSVFRKGKDN